MAITALANLSDANAGWGTISYNGYTIPGLRDVRITGQDVYDRAGRTVTHTRYLARVHFFVVDSGDATHKTTMVDLRRRLQEAGQVLVFTGQGIGDLTINGPSPAVADVEWGPKPRIVEFTQIGGVCTEVVWEVVFAIKHAVSASIGRFLAFNYSVDWEYDEAGVATRTISGYVQIPLTRDNPGQPAAPARSADRYRKQIKPAIPAGMARRQQRFSLSSDRSTLEFTVVDVQLQAEPPPTNCLKAEIDYTMESIPPGFARYVASLSGSIEVPAGSPPIRAAEAFVRLMVDKFAKLKKAAGTKGAVIPVRVRMGRMLTTRTANFSVSWTVNGGCVSDLLREGGLWLYPDDSNWPAWAQSMRKSGAWDPRGTNNLVFNAGADAIVDLNYVGNLPAMGTSPGESSTSASGSAMFKAEGINDQNS